MKPLSGIAIAPMAAAAVLTYMVLVGGTAVGETDLRVGLLNLGLGGLALGYYLARAARGGDRVDVFVLLAVVAFCGAGILSQFPRQSFDASTASLAYAAALFAGRDVLRDRRARRAVLVTMMSLSLVLTVLTAIRWVPAFAEWVQLTRGSVLPPLDMNLHAHPWGHRHDLALLLVMLLPSWWSRESPGGLMRKLLGGAVTMGCLALAVAGGSRTVWLAAGVATLVVTGPTVLRWATSTRPGQIVAGATVLATAVLAVGGAFGPVWDRLLNLNTIGARASMWEAGVELWLRSPLAGVGPGSYPWALQLTEYFDTHSWAPRHPDSVLFQLLPETGFLGIAAVTLVVAAVGPSLIATRSAAARWSLIAFAVAGVGGSPTDFSFLIVVGIAWLAFLIPHADRLEGERERTAGWPVVVAAGLVVIIAIAHLGAWRGAVAYEESRGMVARGDLAGAEERLTQAMGLDPSMALYARQRGAARMLMEDYGGAIRDLQRATATNPSDDLAWRTLAISLRSSSEQRVAELALSRALQAQRSDVTNLLLAIQWAAEDQDSARVLAMAAEVAQGWPAVVSAPGWSDLLGGANAMDVARRAVARWQDGLPGPTPPSLQPLILVALADREDLATDAIADSRLDEDLARAAIDVHACRSTRAVAIAAISSSGQRSAVYWQLVATSATLDGEVDRRAVRILSLISGTNVTASAAHLNPLDENTSEGFSADIWGYRRLPIQWPAALALPSPGAGSQRWLLGSPSDPFPCP